MKFVPCDIPGPMIIEPKVFGDARGFFLESFNAERFADAGLPTVFVQDNHSRSQAGTLRGLHFQNPVPQGKLVRVTAGAVYDVAVDLRRTSANFGRAVGVILSHENQRMFWVPEGFAHGFLALEDDTDFLYKCTAPYAPQHEGAVLWNDPDLAIDWPIGDFTPILSEKDRAAPRLRDIAGFA